MLQLRAWLLALALLLIVAVAPAAMADDDAPDSGPNVVVSVDASSYAPGDPVTASVANGTPLAVGPGGGLVCQGSPWPFTLQLLDDAGGWQDVAYPRTPPCVGIEARLLVPGQTLSKTFAAAMEPGQYRVVYGFRATDGTAGTAASDPFLVGLS